MIHQLGIKNLLSKNCGPVSHFFFLVSTIFLMTQTTQLDIYMRITSLCQFEPGVEKTTVDLFLLMHVLS